MTVSALIEGEMAAPGRPIGEGVFVAVVGPSGAGKDTIIGYARAALAGEQGFEFVRRVITRPADASAEDHDSLDAAAFDAAAATGAFALTWEAHGLKYGLPAGIDHAIAAGRVVIANLSRAVLEALRNRYANVLVVEVTASPETLASRLASRGRESREEVLARLSRARGLPKLAGNAACIDNSGPREVAGERFVALLRKAMATADVAGVC